MNAKGEIIGRVDWRAAFDDMHPGFFEKPGIRSLPEGMLWDEMALPLEGFSPAEVAVPVPDDVTFGFYGGGLDALRDAVRRVDDGWPALFTAQSRVYCGFEAGRLASFCLVEDMGMHEGLRFGGPGCVGTLPEARRKGIGLKMVQNATALLQREGYDVSYIHFTGVAPWYAKLGYRTVLRWGTGGFL